MFRYWHRNVEVKCCRTAPESWIYKTKITFWWQNNEKLEARSQCKALCFEVYFASPLDIKPTMQTFWRRLLLVPLSASYIQDMEYMENEKTHSYYNYQYLRKGSELMGETYKIKLR